MPPTISPENKNPFLQLQSKVPNSANTDAINFSNIPDSTLPPIDTEQQLQNIMDCILPPLAWNDGEHFWSQKTSTIPVTRMDMAALEEQFEAELDAKSAKPFGVCPIRRQLYDQLFGRLPGPRNQSSFQMSSFDKRQLVVASEDCCY